MKPILALVLALIATPALAGVPQPVPEMDIGAGAAALALVLGAAAIVREKFFRK